MTTMSIAIFIPCRWIIFNIMYEMYIVHRAHSWNTVYSLLVSMDMFREREIEAKTENTSTHSKLNPLGSFHLFLPPSLHPALAQLHSFYTWTEIAFSVWKLNLFRMESTIEAICKKATKRNPANEENNFQLKWTKSSKICFQRQSKHRTQPHRKVKELFSSFCAVL